MLDSLATPRRQLVVLAIGVVLAMSPWFATSAVLGELRDRWEIGSLAASWLVITVQLGFVVGAALSASTGLADRLGPNRLVLIGAIGAATANALVVVGDDYRSALLFRGLTGACLALVYPPAMKSMSGWFATGRGVALGTMVGALTLGSALPHLVNALGGFGWMPTLLTISALTVLGGLIIDRLGGPGLISCAAPVRSAPHWDAGAAAVISSRDTSATSATCGALRHVGLDRRVLGDGRLRAGASLIAFAVIGVGAVDQCRVG